jgi:Xaa-Pro dipeptidase
MSIIKPGIHWDAVHFECHKTLVDGFLRLGIFKSEYKGKEKEILDSGVSAAFFPHGL